MLAVGFMQIFFIKLKNFPLVPSLICVFIMNGLWILLNAFWVNWYDNMIFYFYWLHWLILKYLACLTYLAEKAMVPHSSTLAWKFPWTEEPGGLQSMGSPRVIHDWATSLSIFTFMHWRRKWQPTPVFLSGESQGRGEPGGLPSLGSHSQTRLKWLSSSSSSSRISGIDFTQSWSMTLYLLSSICSYFWGYFCQCSWKN